jgi:CRP/FNR family transcriptional regulator, cyclic AMP receptor protein
MLPVITIKEGQIIFEENQLDRRMFLVLEGAVQLYVTRNGHEANLETVDQYEFFGEIEMYKNRPRSMSARALAKTRLAVIKTRMQLEQFIAENPQFSGKMTRLMGKRLADAQLAVL